MKKLIALLTQYRDVIAYLFFGVLTTAVNVVSYHILYNLLSLSNDISTVIAWILAVLFAFFTNKPFVFRSHDWSRKVLLPEARDFFACRIGTGILEFVLMHIFVTRLLFPGVAMKLLVNILVVILNYVGSKFLVFKQK